MRCPTLSDLPPPPPGKTGWPWTEESPQLPDTMPDGKPWPKVSIVTPSYNQGKFIEETIRSVLLQGYPNLEYIIMDGGSTDNSVEIIKKYEKWLAYWVSEPDKGQSDAINKGWKKSTGEILAWLNSDDLYLPNSFNIIADYFSKNPNCFMLYGDCKVINEKGNEIDLYEGKPFNLKKLVLSDYIPQPAAFLRRRFFDKIGYLDVEFQYAMDFDLWLRAGKILKPNQILYIPYVLAHFRLHKESKTTISSIRFLPELEYAYKKFFASPTCENTNHISKYWVLSVLGKHYYNIWDFPNARRLYLQSFFYNPFILFNPLFLYSVMRTFLPKSLIKYYRKNKKYKFLKNIMRFIILRRN